MIKSQSFKISFIATLITLSTLLFFLVTDHNTKNTNFKNSPAIFKIQNINSTSYDVEVIGQKFQINPLKINTNTKYNLIMKTFIPKKLKIIENVICYSCAKINDLINYQKNLDYLDNIK